MSIKRTIWILLASLSFISCVSMYPTRSRFTETPPALGIDKASFLSHYGAPFRINSFYDNDNKLCEELIYRERIDQDANTVRYGDVRAINSIFLFVDGKLVSQFQEDDVSYQIEKERARDRQLVEQSIKAEKERAEAEKERAKAEKKRIEAEKNKGSL